jgi:hypothetical protein
MQVRKERVRLAAWVVAMSVIGMISQKEEIFT